MHKPDPEQANENLDEMVRLGYDTRDVDFPGINRAVGMFFAFTVFCIIAGLITIKFFDWTGGSDLYGAKPSPPIATSPLAPEGAPKLQSNITATLDIERLRREENVRLTTYGWIDEPKGVVRIPVEVALEKALQRGFPERSGAATFTPPPVEEPEQATPGEAPANGSADNGAGPGEVPPTPPTEESKADE